MRCEYCNREMSIDELESRNGRLVCRDISACDRADAEQEEGRRTMLRKLQREGAELTDAEKEFLHGS